jgi:alpha-1,4-N-acetylglucosaminyltransferase EXTL2
MGIPVLRFSLVVILVLLLVAGALTNLLPNAKEDKMLALRRESKSQGKTSLDSFTLIMQTYNRTDLLLRLLNHYQAVPQLHKVIVVWNNVGEKGPDELWNSLGPHPVPVIFKPQTANRMRNRLQVFPELETSGELELSSESARAGEGGWISGFLFVLTAWREMGE